MEMDSNYKFPGSPGTPLFTVSPERVNQQRPPIYEGSPTATVRSHHARDSSVTDKVAAFNSLAFQGKQLERKANDAALKRAMLGREEAESEMRRYREETRSLRRQLEEGRERERRVGERLESVMENYGRAKETYAHTQTLWEKEIRRARKENFKSQSFVVKLQEELKSARNTTKIAEADLEQERERGMKREQEAFAARYQLVGVQEELAQAQEQVKLVEQERDALRTIAKNEEVSRIAAEGQLPLPKLPADDEFASPKKVRRSILPEIVSSAASEEELDEMKMRFEWEQQRANRAHDRIEFLELECRMNCCASRASRDTPTTAEATNDSGSKKIKINSSTTVFIPEEGVFRTISAELPPPTEEPSWISPQKQPARAPTPEQQRPEELRSYARTPSCEPPAPAIPTDANTSLISLLEAPHSPRRTESPIPESEDEDNEEDNDDTIRSPVNVHEIDHSNMIPTFHTISTTTRIPLANPPDLTPLATLPTGKGYTENSERGPLSPTMSREEALAQIRERRGRARSLAQGTMTPKKQMVEGVERRDISAPNIRSGAIRGRS